MFRSMLSPGPILTGSPLQFVTMSSIAPKDAAGTIFEMVKSPINCNVKSDHSIPAGRACFLSTPDKVRSIQSIYFKQTAKEWADVFPIEIMKTESIIDRQYVCSTLPDWSKYLIYKQSDFCHGLRLTIRFQPAISLMIQNRRAGSDG